MRSAKTKLSKHSLWLVMGLSLTSLSACTGEVESSYEAEVFDWPAEADEASDSASTPTWGGILGLNTTSTGRIQLVRAGNRLDTRRSRRFIQFDFSPFSNAPRSYLLDIQSKSPSLGLRYVVQSLNTNTRTWTKVQEGSSALVGSHHRLSSSIELVTGQYRILVTAQEPTRQEGEFEIKVGYQGSEAIANYRSFEIPLCETPSFSADGKTLACGEALNDDSRIGIFESDEAQEADVQTAKSGAVRIYSVAPEGLRLVAYIKAPNASGGDRFGGSLALSGDGKTLAVLASGEDTRGYGFDQDMDGETDAESDLGAVYVYGLNDGDWEFQEYIKPFRQSSLESEMMLSGDGKFTVLQYGAGYLVIDRSSRIVQSSVGSFNWNSKEGRNLLLEEGRNGEWHEATLAARNLNLENLSPFFLGTNINERTVSELFQKFGYWDRLDWQGLQSVEAPGRVVRIPADAFAADPLRAPKIMDRSVVVQTSRALLVAASGPRDLAWLVDRGEWLPRNIRECTSSELSECTPMGPGVLFAYNEGLDSLVRMPLEQFGTQRRNVLVRID